VAVAADNVPAAAQFEEISGGGTFTQNGAAYTLNLGNITTATTVNLGVLNSEGQEPEAVAGRPGRPSPGSRGRASTGSCRIDHFLPFLIFPVSTLHAPRVLSQVRTSEAHDPLNKPAHK